MRIELGRSDEVGGAFQRPWLARAAVVGTETQFPAQSLPERATWSCGIASHSKPLP